MKNTIFALFLIFALSQTTFGQKENTFPTLSGTTLQDKNVNIPVDTRGKYTLLCLTSSQKSLEALSDWFQPVYETFLDDSDYDVNIYFIPMLSGIKELAAGTIEKRMKQGIDPVLHPYILLYKGETGEYKKTLNMQDKEVPYFFVLDKNGKIVYQTSGTYTDKKMEDIEGKIE